MNFNKISRRSKSKIRGGSSVSLSSRSRPITASSATKIIQKLYDTMPKEIPGKKICRIICDPVTERHSKDFKQCINLEEERRARETAKTEGIQKGKEKAFLRNQTICLSKGEDYEY